MSVDLLPTIPPKKEYFKTLYFQYFKFSTRLTVDSSATHVGQFYSPLYARSECLHVGFWQVCLLLMCLMSLKTRWQRRKSGIIPSGAIHKRSFFLCSGCRRLHHCQGIFCCCLVVSAVYLRPEIIWRLNGHGYAVFRGDMLYRHPWASISPYTSHVAETSWHLCVITNLQLLHQGRATCPTWFERPSQHKFVKSPAFLWNHCPLSIEVTVGN